MSVRNPRDIGIVIRAERQRRGLDQRSLAAKVGVSRQWLIGLERGKPGASIGLVLRTLNALGLQLQLLEAPTAPRSKTDFPGTEIDIDSIVEAARRRRS